MGVAGKVASHGDRHVELFDRGSAERIVRASAAELAVLAEARGWPRGWDARTEPGSESLDAFKDELIREECSRGSLRLDYWACMAEVWHGDPPGALTWEQFRYGRPSSDAFEVGGLPGDGSAAATCLPAHTWRR